MRVEVVSCENGLWIDVLKVLGANDDSWSISSFYKGIF